MGITKLTEIVISLLVLKSPMDTCLAQSEERVVIDLGVMSLSPTSGTEFPLRKRKAQVFKNTPNQ